MKIYVVSGLGADFKVLEKLTFPEHLDVVFIDWLIPERNEPFQHYVSRMAEKINTTEPFYLLGYSFGGIMVQEIHKIKSAVKVIILGSLKSHKEKSRLIKTGQLTGVARFFPERFFDLAAARAFPAVRKFFDFNNANLVRYFQVRDPYYLKWSVEQIAAWKSEVNPDVIQIMGDRDLVFPLKYCRPNYIIKGGTHLFPATKPKEVSKLLNTILK
ncbi:MULTISPECIES: alpha/beta hydrolase [Chryseobacterium]|uniref:Alpha/beta hydrolase n=1 Tax=Chryseobacterium camelliae TaxID=1265445 RepID=A0ABU0TEB7_9FLAO|nr:MULTISPECIES: alpha/beta hydrolase [Chryseobacterium]MDT3406796.1 hypothetical protein [Pseudacidovorax intermedius]MDQ1095408.1 hypothetical protein [Chryseobacterium camelliae]MDQ1099348.1 hypothetical protein [Chryseobacterium sp. SORGH_AS_1048]MDR6086694.1 hypothetical protein [Chryseobacterium sp. SORGH_AS_0909]MDR6131066.1 hypothetical protein [Chryseobacterium sp. SORGH_AS_1175]